VTSSTARSFWEPARRRRATGAVRAAIVVVAAGGPQLACADTDRAGLGAPLMLEPGQLQIGGSIEATVDGDRATLAPDLWIGAGRRLTLGLHHSHRPWAATGADRGLCLSGCTDRYGGIALSAHVPVVDGGIRVVGAASLDVADFDPAMVTLDVGAIAAWHQGRLWVRAQPTLALGLMGRDLGNRDAAEVRLVLGVDPLPRLGLEASAGVRGPADADFFAGASAPVWTQVVLRPSPCIGVGVALGFSDVFDRSQGRGAAALAIEVRTPT